MRGNGVGKETRSRMNARTGRADPDTQLNVEDSVGCESTCKTNAVIMYAKLLSIPTAVDHSLHSRPTASCTSYHPSASPGWRPNFKLQRESSPRLWEDIPAAQRSLAQVWPVLADSCHPPQCATIHVGRHQELTRTRSTAAWRVANAIVFRLNW
jgi:hypothetical protein